jgi:catechol 2,3-dioxygenase-like lactoylglutathione lyase family enzyme
MVHLLLLAVRAVGPTAAHQQHRTPPATEISRGDPRHNKRRKPTSKQESGMSTRLDDPTTTDDPILRGLVIVTMAITIVGVVALLRAAVGDGVDHVTVRVDNQAGLAVRVDALDASGDRVGLGEAEPRTLTTFQEIPDIGARWTLVATYGGQEVHRATLARTALAAGNWTVTIPAGATAPLERAGFQ